MKIPPDIQWLMTQEICGIVSAQQRTQLETYLQDPDYLAYYQQLKSRFESIDTADPELGGFSAQQVAKLIITQDHKRKARIKTIWFIAAAATVVVVLSGVLWMNQKHQTATKVAGVSVKVDGQSTIDLSAPHGLFEGGSYSTTDSILSINSNNSNKSISIEVPPGHRFKVRLPDSSEVELNSGSTLEYALNFRYERKTIITGEGYFSVNKSTTPFTVTAGNVGIEVLGTTFNVNTYKPGIVIIGLVNGAVKVSHGNESKLIKPGHKLIYSNNQMQVTSLEPGRDIGWLNGFYSFNNYPVDSLAQDMERIYGIKVSVGKSQFFRITGTIFTADLQKSLSRLQSAGLLTYHLERGHLTLHSSAGAN